MSKENSIWNLPDYEPSKGLWSSIEKDLDKIPSYQNIEDAIDFLKEYEPKSNLWANIESELDRPKFFRFNINTTAIIFILLFLGLGVIFYINQQNSVSGTVDSKLETNLAIDIRQVSETLNIPIEKDIKETKVSDIEKLSSTPDENDTNSQNTKTRQVIEQRKSNIEQEYFTPPVDTLNNKFDVIAIVDEKELEKQPMPDYINNKDSEKVNEEPDNIGKSRDTNIIPQDRNSISIGFHYTKELATTSYCDQISRNAYSLDISLAYNMQNFFIESGISASLYNSKPVLGVNYRQDEVVDSYEQVDSISYVYSGTPGEFDKEYYISHIEVHDSIDYYANYKSVYQVSYLNIPLYLGYKFKLRNFDYYIKAGGMLSFQINNNNIYPVIPKGATILSIDNYPQNSPKQKWKFVFGTGIILKISNHFSFNVEAQYNYFVKSVNVEGCKNNRHSLSGRIGLLYEF